ncbi:MAG: glycoside hydrolase family 125 protein [Bifidobacteriaceae bacterium]|jgi:meiotically up-regulated gene 157 (Mug157) protein|nr:glycoside hydrolase family 125 protein [Bifidobacteriaceae bacterium]
MAFDWAGMARAASGLADDVRELLDPSLVGVAPLFRVAFTNLIESKQAREQADSTVWLMTGDIPAMWLRDSAAQVRPYLPLAVRDERFAELLIAVNQRQFRFITHDPYANAFNETASGAHWDAADEGPVSPWVWERKFELDSLAYPIALAWDIAVLTGHTDHLDGTFTAAARTIVATWDAEADHTGRSSYRFSRPGAAPLDTLAFGGHGAPVHQNGLLWEGFRPSDDACTYNLSIPGNAFTAVAARKLAALIGDQEPGLASRALDHAGRIDAAIIREGLVELDGFGQILAYEIDGMGHANLMDDANIPSLLSLPYLGWCEASDSLYLRTRRFVLSPANPYYYEGAYAAGVGSPHVGEQRRVWPIALAMQALTANGTDERRELLRVLAATDAGTGLLHEAFHVDNPADFTRAWFGWANALFSEAVLVEAGLMMAGHCPLRLRQAVA